MLKKWSQIINEIQSSHSLYDSENKEYESRQRSSYFNDKSSFDFISLIETWPELVGKLLGENSVPIKIQTPFLIILTKHPIFSQELKHLEVTIIKKVTEKYPLLENKISKIKYIVNETFFNIKKETIIPKKENKFHPFDPKFINAKNEAEIEFSNVEDPELKDLFINIYIHHKMQN
jgi:hypothetical protein